MRISKPTTVTSSVEMDKSSIMLCMQMVHQVGILNAFLLFLYISTVVHSEDPFNLREKGVPGLTKHKHLRFANEAYDQGDLLIQE
ncbi:hypothetical protein J2T58_002080 [Methanocalculus alkaliphilus]|nr:hypothetical protein [Methanocalculus alkaliphilus]